MGYGRGMKLYNHHASSASFRVRIGLHWKGLPFEYAPVALKWEGGEQHGAPYTRLNPQGLVPTLVDGYIVLRQSLAILEYLEETHPQPPLLPQRAAERARVRQLALTIACEIQPLGNLRVDRYLHDHFSARRDATRAWRAHWIETGFAALEALLAESPATGAFCHGDTLTLADCCLVPQVTNALRPGTAVDLSPYPTLRRIYEACLRLPAVQAALPERQPDAPASPPAPDRV